MSNLLGFAIARRTSRGELLAGWLDGGEIRVYNGTRPADPDTAITSQILLVTLELPDPATSVSNGILTGNTVSAALIAETGNATWARILDNAAVTIGDCDLGLEGSGAFIELDSLSLVEGGYCSIVNFSIVEG